MSGLRLLNSSECRPSERALRAAAPVAEFESDREDGETVRRYIIYLKDGRTPEAQGLRLDPNIERVFQGQTRSFVTVSDGDMETAVFLAQDVLGWTIENDGGPASSAFREPETKATIPAPPPQPLARESVVRIGG
jgi:hypothetical protein